MFKVLLSEEVVKRLEGLADEKEEKGSGGEEGELVMAALRLRSASPLDIKLIAEYFKEDGVRIHELLASCEIELPRPIPEERNPELEARLVRLRMQADQEAYNRMTKNVRAKGVDPDDSLAAQIRFMNKQLVAVAQFVVSVGSGFAFGFYGVELLAGELDFGFKLLLGVICALVIALAEIYFLAKIIAELDLEGTVPAPPAPAPTLHIKPHQD